MYKITSLSDVVNILKLDVYKRQYMSELKEYELTIDEKKRINTVNKYNKIARSVPTSYLNQPEEIKLFLPPIPELFEELNLNMTIDEQRHYQELENNKRQNETLKMFGCEDNFLIAIYEDKNKNDVFYTYNYDYEDTNSLNLLSRVVYR